MTEEPINIKRTNREISNANLKPIKPGEVRNPTGRPIKDISILSRVKELLEQEPIPGKSNAQLVAEALVELAKSKGARGQVAALLELFNRTDGKVKDVVEIQGEMIKSIVKDYGDATK